MRVQRGGFGKIVYGGTGHDLRAAGGRGEPACKGVACAGNGRCGRGIRLAVGGGCGLGIGRAIVAVESDGVGVGLPLRNEGFGRIRRTGGVAEGVSIAFQRAVGGRGAGPAGEGIAGLYGSRDGYGIAAVAVGGEGTGVGVFTDGHRGAIEGEQHVAVVDVPVRVHGGIFRSDVIALEGGRTAGIVRGGEPTVKRMACPRYGGSLGPGGVIGCRAGGVVRGVVVLIIGYGVGLGIPGSGKGISGFIRTEGIGGAGKRAVIARSGPAREIVTRPGGIVYGKRIKIRAVKVMRGSILGGADHNLAAVGIHGERALVDIPVRIQRGGGGQRIDIRFSIAERDLIAALGRGEPAREIVTGSGGIFHRGIRRVIGGGGGTCGGYAAVGVEGDGIGVRGPGGGKRIGCAVSRTEGVGAAFQRAVRAGAQDPTREGVAGLGGRAEAARLFISAGVFRAVFNACKRAAVKGYRHRAGVRGRSLQREHRVGGEVILYGVGDGAAVLGRCNSDVCIVTIKRGRCCGVAFRQRDAEREGIEVTDGSACRRYGRIDRKGIGAVIDEGERVSIRSEVIKGDLYIVGIGGFHDHADMGGIDLLKGCRAVHTCEGEIRSRSLRVAVRQLHNKRGVTEICNGAGFGCGGNEAGALIQRNPVDVFNAGHVQRNVRGDVAGNGNHVSIRGALLQSDGGGKAFLFGDHFHAGRGILEAVRHGDLHGNAGGIVGYGDRCGLRGKRFGIHKIGGNVVEKLRAGNGDHVIIVHAGHAYRHHTVINACGKAAVAGNVYVDRVDVIALFGCDGEGVIIKVIGVLRIIYGVAFGRAVQRNAVHMLRPLGVNRGAGSQHIILRQVHGGGAFGIRAPADEIVTRAGGLGCGRRPGLAVGGRFGLGIGRAVVAVKHHGVGVGGPLRFVVIRALRGAVGVGVAGKRTGRRGGVRALGHLLPAGEGIARSGGRRYGVGCAVAVGIGNKRGIIRIFTAVGIELDGGSILQRIGQRDHHVAGDVRNGIGIAAGNGGRYGGAAHCGARDQIGAGGYVVAIEQRDAEGDVAAVRYGALDGGPSVALGRFIPIAAFRDQGHGVGVERQRVGSDNHVGFAVVGNGEDDGIAGLVAVRDCGGAFVHVSRGIRAGGLGVAVLKHNGEGLAAAVGDGLGLRGGFGRIREVEAGVHPEGDLVFLGGPNRVQIHLGIVAFAGGEVLRGRGNLAAIVNDSAVRAGGPAIDGVAQAIAEVILGREGKLGIVVNGHALFAGGRAFYVIVIGNGIGVLDPIRGERIGNEVLVAEGIYRGLRFEAADGAVRHCAVLAGQRPAGESITGLCEIAAYVIDGAGILGHDGDRIVVYTIDLQRALVADPLCGERYVIILIAGVVNALQQQRARDRIALVVNDAVRIMPLGEGITGIAEAVIRDHVIAKLIVTDRLAAGAAGGAFALIVVDDVGVGRPLRVEPDHMVRIGKGGQIGILKGIARIDGSAADTVFYRVPACEAVTGLLKAALGGVGVHAERIVNDALVCGTVARSARACIIFNGIGDGFPFGVEGGIRIQRVTLSGVAELGVARLFGVPALKGVADAGGGGQNDAAGRPLGRHGDGCARCGGKVHNLLLVGIGIAAESPAVERGLSLRGGIGRIVIKIVGSGMDAGEAFGAQILVHVVGEALVRHHTGGVAVAVESHGIGDGRPDRVQRDRAVLARVMRIGERAVRRIFRRVGGIHGVPADKGITGERGNCAVKRQIRAVGLGLIAGNRGGTGSGNVLAVLGQVGIVGYRVGVRRPLRLKGHVAVFAVHGFGGGIGADPVVGRGGRIIGHKPAGEIVALLGLGAQRCGLFGIIVLRFGIGFVETVFISDGVGHKIPLGVQRHVRGGRIGSALVADEGGKLRIRIPACEGVAVAGGRGQRGGIGGPLGVQREGAGRAHQVLYGRTVGIIGRGSRVHTDGVGVPSGKVIGYFDACGIVAAGGIIIIVCYGVLALERVGGKGLFLIVFKALVRHRDVGVGVAVAVKAHLIGDGIPLRIQRDRGVLRVRVVSRHGSALGVRRAAAVRRRVPAREGITGQRGLGGAQGKRGIVGLGLVIGNGGHRIGGCRRLIGIISYRVGHGLPDGVYFHGAVFAGVVTVADIVAGLHVHGVGCGGSIGVPALKAVTCARRRGCQRKPRAVRFVNVCGIGHAGHVCAVGVIMHGVDVRDPPGLQRYVAVFAGNRSGCAIAFRSPVAAVGGHVPTVKGITGFCGGRFQRRNGAVRGRGDIIVIRTGGIRNDTGQAVRISDGVTDRRPDGIQIQRAVLRHIGGIRIEACVCGIGPVCGGIVRIPAEELIPVSGGRRSERDRGAVGLGDRGGAGHAGDGIRGIAIINYIISKAYPLCVQIPCAVVVVPVSAGDAHSSAGARLIIVPALQRVAGAAPIGHVHPVAVVGLRGACRYRGTIVHVEHDRIGVGRPFGVQRDGFVHRELRNRTVQTDSAFRAVVLGVGPAGERIAGLGKRAGIARHSVRGEIQAIRLRRRHSARAGVGVVNDIVGMLHPVRKQFGIGRGTVLRAGRAYAARIAGAGNRGVPAFQIVTGADEAFQRLAAAVPNGVQIHNSVVNRGQLAYVRLIAVIDRAVVGALLIVRGPTLEGILERYRAVRGRAGIVLVIRYVVFSDEGIGRQGFALLIGEALVAHRTVRFQRAVEPDFIIVLRPLSIQRYAAVLAGIQIIVVDGIACGKGAAAAVRSRVPARKGPARKGGNVGRQVHVGRVGFGCKGEPVHIHAAGSRHRGGGFIRVIYELVGVRRPVREQFLICGGRVFSAAVADQVAAGGCIVPALEGIADTGGIRQSNLAVCPLCVQLLGTGGNKIINLFLIIILLCAGRRFRPTVKMGGGVGRAVGAAGIIVIIRYRKGTHKVVRRKRLRIRVVGERLIAVAVAGGTGCRAIAVKMNVIGVGRPRGGIASVTCAAIRYGNRHR